MNGSDSLGVFRFPGIAAVVGVPALAVVCSIRMPSVVDGIRAQVAAMERSWYIQVPPWGYWMRFPSDVRWSRTLCRAVGVQRQAPGAGASLVAAVPLKWQAWWWQQRR